MDFKHLSDKNRTPKSNINKVLSNAVNCDSPFRSMPNFSTPPSRFSKIINPFENHLLERMHLPTCSPSVFQNMSTPKQDKFIWTIDDISQMRPADIDEATVSQHVNEVDPHVESIVQEKINRFFNESVVVPSPDYSSISSKVPLIKENLISSYVTKRSYSNGSAQTVLSLPPVLPEEIEEILSPYFSQTENQQRKSPEMAPNSMLYRQLFDQKTPKNMNQSIASQDTSPALSTGLSPIQFSPVHLGVLTDDFHNLSDCTLSPICLKGATPADVPQRPSFSQQMSVDGSVIVPDLQSQMSICQTSVIEPTPAHVPQRPSFSQQMSVDGSVIVPDLQSQMSFCQTSVIEPTPAHVPQRPSFSQQMSVDGSVIVPDLQSQMSFCQTSVIEENLNQSPKEALSDSTVNWDMEYKQTSMSSSQGSNSSGMEVTTPQSKKSTSQRKRLSDSFKDEEDKENERNTSFNLRRVKQKIDFPDTGCCKNDVTDAGYMTGSMTCEDSNWEHLFASTPSKKLVKTERALFVD